MDFSYTLQLIGALCFGTLVGWYLYYINRNRKEEVKLGDLVSLVGVLGGGAILTLFPAKSDLFGAYGIGLAAGFFGYFFTLVLLVRKCSRDFDYAWFLDGRKKVDGKVLVPEPGHTPMGIPMEIPK